MTVPNHAQNHHQGIVLNGNTFSSHKFPAEPLGPFEVKIALQSASLNARDQMIRKGQYGEMPADLVPLSDGAGEVIAVGEQVTKWSVGDRVMPTFFQDWLEGPFQPSALSSAISSADQPGVLREQAKFHQDTLVGVPDHMSFQEAATLPCAGVTAWHALFEQHRALRSEDTVLIQGTGGVAIFALQLAKAFGARVVLISSSDEKLEKAKEMGADITINYKTTPDWDVELRELTDGHGADVVLDLGGKETLERSIRAVAAHGLITQVGVLTGWAHAPENISQLVLNNSSLSGVLVGSRVYFENLCAFVSKHQIKPLIDKSFFMSQIDEAYAYMDQAQHMGKVTIDIA
ncbi:zinc-dependent alcohol dehydrogenase family protein [Pseudovibrio sp. Alg231-02]|uniref:zinc-dependent alcohol dehydrogenase family protein n=1 Tax=Pseudovibrio sp. Alg231-02 TaxID=1922223 RepID=UPI000D558CD9|nr:NAD(P)-dependent alcohol dehydrogenase [Pseudovibrio sp. Alg231-02]